MIRSIKFILSAFAMGSLLSFTCQEQKPNTKEARGLWVARWEWAIQSDSNRVQMQQDRVVQIFNNAKQAKLNFILFQIRGQGDAFYRSNYEPWSDLLTDTLGKDPGWDPLAFALDQAHSRGLELHVWFNTFPVWKGIVPPPHSIPEHIYHAHPEWIVCDRNGKPMPLSSNYVSLSPGIPEVREYIHRVAMDIVQNYDIDGFHFDYIRYPDQSDKLGYSLDSVSLHLFNSPLGNPQQLNWEDWQRENINQFVRNFYDDATSLKPWLKISAAVIGKYDYSEWNGYHTVFQDAQTWMNEGKMDFIAPMIYWPTDHPTAPYKKIVHHWFNMTHERYIFPGMMINELGTKEWPDTEVLQQVKINREGGNGMILFSSLGLEKLVNQFGHPGFYFLANMPPMNWKDDKPPMDPRNLRARFISGKVVLIWSPPDSSLDPTDVWRYNIFRSEHSPVDFMNAQNLIEVKAQPDTFYIDHSVPYNRTLYYVVTALDRAGNESPPSNQVAIAIPQYVLMNSLKITNSD